MQHLSERDLAAFVVIHSDAAGFVNPFDTSASETLDQSHILKDVFVKLGVGLFQYFAGKVGGTGEMIEKGLPLLLKRLAPTDQLLLFGGPENLHPFADCFQDSRVQLLEFPISSKGRTLLRAADLIAPGWGTRSIVAQLNAQNLDAIWFPQQSLFPHGVRAASLVTCVDLQHHHLPENFSRAERWGRFQKDRQMVRSANRIACISQATRDDLRTIHKAPPSKLSVVYLGGGCSDLRTDINLAGDQENPYLYFPANSYPHKNHIRLIRAFREFKRRHPESQLRLVMTGQIYPHLQQELNRGSAGEGIEHLGFVPTPQKETLFRESTSLFFPSLFEGFGIPIIEAMSYGKRIFCHRLPVFQELVGEEADYFDARTEAGILACLEQQFLHPKQLRTPDLQAYRKILKQLNWDRYADEMFTLLSELAHPQCQSQAGNILSRSA